MSRPSRPLLRSMTLDGFLSFAYGTPQLPLSALNVVIGPNGSGKEKYGLGELWISGEIGGMRW